MTKILFVDDDAIARRNIENRIHWAQNGMELIYSARDGIDALEYMKDHKPDIIISDIKMPVMDGIEMAMIAKDYYPDLKFIFLSGYKEFEYAQQALKLNAVDYLTKPVDTGQLLSIIKKAQSQLEKEKNIDLILQGKYPLIKRHYISKLMRENFQEMDDSVFKAFDINLNQGLGVVGFIDFPYGQDQPLDYIGTRIQDLCNMLTSKYKGSFFFCMDTMEIFMVYTNSDSNARSRFEEYLRELESFVNLYLDSVFHTKAVFHYGTTMHNLNDFYQSYQTAQQSLNSEADSLLLNIKKYIEHNYGNSELSLIMIASHFNINHCYLTSIFKAKFGINLYDFLIQIRMERAGAFIRTTQLKNYEIAERVGYKNSQYFSVSFKKYFSCTVTQYRDRVKDLIS